MSQALLDSALNNMRISFLTGVSAGADDYGYALTSAAAVPANMFVGMANAALKFIGVDQTLGAASGWLFFAFMAVLLVVGSMLLGKGAWSVMSL